MSLSIFVVVGEKRTVALPPEHIHRKSTKISIPLKYIQFNVISHIKKIKILYKSLKILTVATMELYLLKIYATPKKLPPEASEYYSYLTASIFTLFYFTLRIFKFLLRTYFNKACTRFCPKARNFMLIDSEIISMKSEMSRFVPVCHFSPGSPLYHF